MPEKDVVATKPASKKAQKAEEPPMSEEDRILKEKVEAAVATWAAKDSMTQDFDGL